MSWLEDPVALFLTLPPMALPLIAFAAAWLKYVVPVFPGDGCLLLAFFLAGQGAAAAEQVFLAAWAGSTLGAVVAYRLGARYGLAVLDRVTLRRAWRWRASERLRALLEQHGERILLFNRFLPLVRHFMLYGAGAFRMRFAPSILYSAASNLAFIALLGTAGLLTAGSWQEIRHGFQELNRNVGLVLAGALAAWLYLHFWRAERQRARDLD